MSATALTVAETSENGRILIEGGGHRFPFGLATSGGAQSAGAQILEAFHPEWANGVEPSDAHGLSIKARELAEAEARDRGWITVGEPDVG